MPIDGGMVCSCKKMPLQRSACLKSSHKYWPEPDRVGFVRGLSLKGFHRVAYADWGPLDAPETVVCVHGLTRQGRDFDFLAADLAKAATG